MKNKLTIKEKKNLQASKRKCTECGSPMRASKIGKEWKFICIKGPYHKKVNGSGYAGKNRDAMNYLLSGSYGSRRGG